MVRAITVRDEACVEMEDIAVHSESLPVEVKRAIVDSVRREVRAWSLDARRAAVPPGGPPAGPDPTGARFADEHRITIDDGGLRNGLQKLSAPATPKG